MCGQASATSPRHTTGIFWLARGVKKGDGAGRIVLARSLEVIVAVVIVLIGVLGWKLIIVDVWLAETDEQSIGVAHALTAKTH
jgi:hypothetical protein